MMSFLAAIRVAFDSLLVHKGRSALTSLGIVIGIATVISLVSAGQSVRQRMAELLDGAGKNLILVRARAHTTQEFVNTHVPLLEEDAAAIRKHAGHLLSGVAESQAMQRVASTASHQHSTLIVGAVPDLQRVRNWKAPHGRFLAEEDLKKEAAVCLIGQRVRERLFPEVSNPVGEMLRIEHLEFRIIGVLGAKGKLPIGFDQDDQIFVPLTTLQNKLAGEKRLVIITAAARSSELVEPARQEILRVLRENRRHRPGEADEIDVTTVREVADLAFAVATTIQVLIAVIASVSLVVGGIGIMNILLASVAERTREIGIRLAVGARPGDVLMQFLMEGLVLSLAGGLLGVVLGFSLTIGIAAAAGWRPVISPGTVLLAFAVSAAVGLFFSYYPALKASRLDPMTAMRCE
jgi:putative ABC transport system permease protein